uniref:pyruvate, water dikinase regulatory protein n=1 Tax=Ndongobacter massiliensis TaxID=1871025 RepID=UPI0009306121|nr:pyruvate, water dikinase regulatory protein [Ndongobacter massiliensis]
MKHPILYAISDGDGQGVELLVKQAIANTSCAFDVRTFHNVDNQLDLERILLRSVNAKEEPLVFFAMQREDLIAYLSNFCDFHGLLTCDVLGSLAHRIRTYMRNCEKACEKQNPLSPQETSAPVRRVDALDFALQYDDGKDPHGLALADVCLIGVSRTSKTPLSIYLANKHLRVINVPLVPESEPPQKLFEISPSKVFGLTASAQSLAAIRRERLKSLGLPNTAPYATQSRILRELGYAQEIMKKIGCAIIDVTSRSIEETAEIILRDLAQRK